VRVMTKRSGFVGVFWHYHLDGKGPHAARRSGLSVVPGRLMVGRDDRDRLQRRSPLRQAALPLMRRALIVAAKLTID
jgi:hypothetical protein